MTIYSVNSAGQTTATYTSNDMLPVYGAKEPIKITFSESKSDKERLQELRISFKEKLTPDAEKIMKELGLSPDKIEDIDLFKKLINNTNVDARQEFYQRSGKFLTNDKDGKLVVQTTEQLLDELGNTYSHELYGYKKYRQYGVNENPWENVLCDFACRVLGKSKEEITQDDLKNIRTIIVNNINPDDLENVSGKYFGIKQLFDLQDKYKDAKLMFDENGNRISDTNGPSTLEILLSGRSVEDQNRIKAQLQKIEDNQNLTQKQKIKAKGKVYLKLIKENYIKCKEWRITNKDDYQDQLAEILYTLYDSCENRDDFIALSRATACFVNVGVRAADKTASDKLIEQAKQLRAATHLETFADGYTPTVGEDGKPLTEEEQVEYRASLVATGTNASSEDFNKIVSQACENPENLALILDGAFDAEKQSSNSLTDTQIKNTSWAKTCVARSFNEEMKKNPEQGEEIFQDLAKVYASHGKISELSTIFDYIDDDALKSKLLISYQEFIDTLPPEQKQGISSIKNSAKNTATSSDNTVNNYVSNPINQTNTHAFVNDAVVDRVKTETVQQAKDNNTNNNIINEVLKENKPLNNETITEFVQELSKMSLDEQIKVFDSLSSANKKDLIILLEDNPVLLSQYISQGKGLVLLKIPGLSLRIKIKIMHQMRAGDSNSQKDLSEYIKKHGLEEIYPQYCIKDKPEIQKSDKNNSTFFIKA